MTEKEFTQLAKKTLDTFADTLDKFDESGDLEMDYQNGIITITFNSGKQIIVNKHAPSQQIWMSSPLSGGKHFSYDAGTNSWILADGVMLGSLLSGELKILANIDVTL